MGKQDVRLTLGRDEALVLFDWLGRFNQDPRPVFEDQAEERVLFDLEASLEKQLVEAIEANYGNAVRRARDAVRDKDPPMSG